MKKLEEYYISNKGVNGHFEFSIKQRLEQGGEKYVFASDDGKLLEKVMDLLSNEEYIIRSKQLGTCCDMKERSFLDKIRGNEIKCDNCKALELNNERGENKSYRVENKMKSKKEIRRTGL